MTPPSSEFEGKSAKEIAREACLASHAGVNICNRCKVIEQALLTFSESERKRVAVVASEEAIHLAAQLWCLPQHANKVMDPEFALSIAELIISERKRGERLRRQIELTQTKWTEELVKEGRVALLMAQLNDYEEALKELDEAFRPFGGSQIAKTVLAKWSSKKETR